MIDGRAKDVAANCLSTYACACEVGACMAHMVVDAMYAIIGELSLKDAMRCVRGSNVVRPPRRKRLNVKLQDVRAHCYIFKIFASTGELVSLKVGDLGRQQDHHGMLLASES